MRAAASARKEEKLHRRPSMVSCSLISHLTGSVPISYNKRLHLTDERLLTDECGKHVSEAEEVGGTEGKKEKETGKHGSYVS